MDNFNPKVSFIPKGSLVREESFLDRSRPRSVMGFIASTIFILTLGAYLGLYYYNDSLNKIVAEKTTEIKKAQKEFSDAPEVGEARVFRARVDLAREILNAHTVASPVFAFLSKNTLSSVLFERFAFKDDPTSGVSLELAGEAPTYSALAYQLDTLRAQKELRGVSLSAVNLTNFGTINFTLTLDFKRDYLLYAKSLSTESTTASDQSAVSPVNLSPVIVDTPTVSTSSTATEPLGGFGAATTSSLAAAPASSTATSSSFDAGVSSSTSAVATSDWTTLPVEQAATTPVEPVKQPFWMLLWSKLKFW